MKHLFLMRHGQTEYNLAHRIQGHCDSPLTELGIEQARTSALWLRDERIVPARLASSPLPRATRTLDVVVEVNPGFAALPRTDEDGLIERCYGSFEGGPQADLPADPWDPKDALVPYGGDSEAEARERMVATLTRLMDESDGDVLAVSHGSVTNLFKKTWERLARCPQDVALGNCCVLVFDYDPVAKTFSNTKIMNPIGV